MKIEHAINLIQNKNINTETKTIWADLGCGAGLFTYALAKLLYDGSIIYAVDKNISLFKKNTSFKNATIKPVELNFEKVTLSFDYLDGIIMANSLHYVKDKINFIEKIRKNLNEKGCFLIVEYDMERPNHWVPYPINFLSLQKLFHESGYSFVEKINERPSAFNRGNLYSALIKD